MSEPSLMHANCWTAQVNDLVGGWIVTDYPHPLSEHDNRWDGDTTKGGYIVAECWTERDACTIAMLLNEYQIKRTLLWRDDPECL